MNYMILFFAVLIIVIIIVVIVVEKRHHKEGYNKCVCSSSMDMRECQDTEVVKDLYETSTLTENTNLKSRDWSKVSPGDINWPISEGCDWPDNTKNAKEWQKWDFTDF